MSTDAIHVLNTLYTEKKLNAVLPNYVARKELPKTQTDRCLAMLDFTLLLFSNLLVGVGLQFLQC